MKFRSLNRHVTELAEMRSSENLVETDVVCPHLEAAVRSIIRTIS